MNQYRRAGLISWSGIPSRYETPARLQASSNKTERFQTQAIPDPCYRNDPAVSMMTRYCYVKADSVRVKSHDETSLRMINRMTAPLVLGDVHGSFVIWPRQYRCESVR
jgi:hypothetical protein